MTESDAYEWAMAQGEHLDYEECCLAHVAVFGCSPDSGDNPSDIFSHVCAGLSASGYDVHE